MADRTVMRMKRHGMLRMSVDVAIDKHTIPRYDKTYNMLNIITSKFKNGTYHFNVTIQVPDYYHELVMAGSVRSDILA